MEYLLVVVEDPSSWAWQNVQFYKGGTLQLTQMDILLMHGIDEAKMSAINVSVSTGARRGGLAADQLDISSISAKTLDFTATPNMFYSYYF
jgi:hypothetical protein